MREWLPESHLVWFVLDVVARVDTSVLHARHPNDGPGRPGYDPDMMLGLLLYAYATGTRSSRRIEQLCATDAAYRVLAGHAVPDHATLARFVVDHEAAIAGVFIDVLRLCAAAGLVTLGTIAVDGTKVGADAALDANRDVIALRAEVQRIVAEARATDADEDSQPGLLADDVLPPELATRGGRQQRLEAALAQVEAAEQVARVEVERLAARAQKEAQRGRKLHGRKPKDPRAALARAEADEAAARARVAVKTTAREQLLAEATAQGRPVVGRPPGQRLERELAVAEQVTARARKAVSVATQPVRPQANITDPQSRIMKTPGGWVQGYNAQAAVNGQQIVVAGTVTQQHNDVAQYQPMVAATLAALDAANITTPIGCVLADAGYWSEGNATADGPDRLIATLKDHKQRRAARRLGTTTGEPPDDATPVDAMEHRLRTPQGAATYAKRSHTVEPVFGDHKHNRGFTRFRRRGLTAVQSEWALMNTVHNLGKLFRHRLALNGAAPAII